jgi:hypothetical protein
LPHIQHLALHCADAFDELAAAYSTTTPADA